MDTPTVLLGQFTDENAEAIVARLEDAGITWWVKQTGRWSQLLFAGEWGVRVFVEQERAQDAAAIAVEVTDGR